MPTPFHRPNVRLDLEVRSGPYCPGDDVNVRVSLVPQESAYVREGLVELACTETYYISHSEGAPSKHSHELWRSTLSLLQNEQVLSGQIYGGDFKFTVPADAVPTVKGQAAEITWAVRASLDVARARDIHRQRQLRVVSPAPESARADVVEEAYPQCELWLSLSEVTVPAGGDVQGKFTIQVWQDLKVQQIRIELECLEKAGDKSASTIKDQMVLKDRESLEATQVLEWPIRLHVPKLWAPSTDVHHTQVEWRVKGVLDRSMRMEWDVHRQIQVYTVP